MTREFSGEGYRRYIVVIIRSLPCSEFEVRRSEARISWRFSNIFEFWFCTYFGKTEILSQCGTSGNAIWLSRRERNTSQRNTKIWQKIIIPTLYILFVGNRAKIRKYNREGSFHKAQKALPLFETQVNSFSHFRLLLSRARRQLSLENLALM